MTVLLAAAVAAAFAAGYLLRDLIAIHTQSQRHTRPEILRTRRVLWTARDPENTEPAAPLASGRATGSERKGV